MRVSRSFEKMGVKVIHVGENGMGTTLKLINNLIMGVAIEAASEALVLAVKAGIDPKKVIEITSVGGARTGAMETRGPRMIQGDFSPHFSVNNMYKDLSTALKLAEEFGVSLPATSIFPGDTQGRKVSGKRRSGFLRRDNGVRGHGRHGGEVERLRLKPETATVKVCSCETR